MVSHLHPPVVPIPNLRPTCCVRKNMRVVVRLVRSRSTMALLQFRLINLHLCLLRNSSNWQSRWGSNALPQSHVDCGAMSDVEQLAPARPKGKPLSLMYSLGAKAVVVVGTQRASSAVSKPAAPPPSKVQGTAVALDYTSEGQWRTSRQRVSLENTVGICYKARCSIAPPLACKRLCWQKRTPRGHTAFLVGSDQHAARGAQLAQRYAAVLHGRVCVLAVGEACESHYFPAEPFAPTIVLVAGCNFTGW